MKKFLEYLCEEINMPKEAEQEVLYLADTLDWETLQPGMSGFFEREQWEYGRNKVKKQVGEDERGMKMLTCMLAAGRETRKRYKEKGIMEQVFLDTMACFSRFVKEYQVSYGTPGFDRDFWCVRQLSMQLFRIGEMEYELETEGNGKALNLHIPSDAGLDPEGLRDSADAAAEFFVSYAPAYEKAPVLCNSWLLSPALEKVLKKESNILRFQRAFQLLSVDEDDTEFMIWVYKRSDIPLQDLPEGTSLQKNMKAYLLSGKKIGSAKGILVNPW